MHNTRSKPYSATRLFWRYIIYRIRANNKHKVHSPTIFSFANEVFYSAKKMYYKTAEQERKRAKKSKQILDFVDYGKNGALLQKSVAEIAKRSLKSPKYARLLGAIVDHREAKTILELGTSLGITTAYLARQKNTRVTTLEGDPSVAAIAQSVWNQLGHTNITCIIGQFEKTLDNVVNQSFDIIYIDGNHRQEPTLRYFDLLLPSSHNQTLFVFDDIHYSREMEKAWETIKNHPRVYSTIDLFFMGIVYINPSLSKQHFTLRY